MVVVFKITMLYKKLKDGWVSIMSGYIGIPVDRICLEWYFVPFSSQAITCIAVFLRWSICTRACLCRQTVNLCEYHMVIKKYEF